ncbi:MAG: Nramp family divalent metal transporter [Acidobacteria bacterium]|nr:Nramp family divalent metal transporter [Acidobacteriota bacterium]
MPRLKLADLGPGLLLAATGVGVGDMVSSTIAGAEYGLALLWALAAGVAIKFAITEGLARWQLATGLTLLEGWREVLPRGLPFAFLVYFVVWSYAVSSALVAASTLVPAALVPGVPVPIWGVLHAVVAFTLVYFGRYDRFLGIIKTFVLLKFAAVVAAALLIAFRSGAEWSPLGTRALVSPAYVLSLIGGVGGTVTLLSYGYWMREARWTGTQRLGSARADLAVSFGLVFVFCVSILFIAAHVTWDAAVLDEGPRLCLLLADRIGRETGPVGRGIFLAGFWGVAYASVLGVWHGVPFLFDDWLHRWRGQAPAGQQGRAYRLWAAYLTLASISALVIGRPVWIIFVYTLIGSLFFPFVIATLLWLNNSTRMPARARNGWIGNLLLGASLVLFGWLAVDALLLP